MYWPFFCFQFFGGVLCCMFFFVLPFFVLVTHFEMFWYLFYFYFHLVSVFLFIYFIYFIYFHFLISLYTDCIMNFFYSVFVYFIFIFVIIFFPFDFARPRYQACESYCIINFIWPSLNCRTCSSSFLLLLFISWGQV